MVHEGVLRQWIATTTCCLSAGMIATCYVWPAPLLTEVLPWLDGPLNWIPATMPLGMFVFALPAGLLADRFGRKAVLLQACPLVLVSWIVAIVTQDLVALYIVRVVQGFAMAIVYVVAPIYLAEIAETRKRGVLTGQFQVMYLLGCVYAYTMGSLLPVTSYICTLMVVPIMSIVAFYTMPESPYYLIMCGRTEQALYNLQWLRGSDDVDDEYQIIRESVQRDMVGPRTLGDLVATESDKRSLSIVILLSTLRSLCGMNAVSVYLMQELTQDAKGIFASQPMAINLMVVTLACSFASTCITDSVGRKPVLIFSTIGTTAFCSMVAIFYSLETSVDSHSWIMYVAIVGFSVSYNVGLGGLMQTIQGEYFPTRTRAMGGAVATTISGLLMFCCLAVYDILRQNRGNYLNYGLYTFISLIGIIVLPVAYHETAGRTLAQIQEIGICKKKSTKAITTTDISEELERY